MPRSAVGKKPRHGAFATLVAECLHNAGKAWPLDREATGENSDVPITVVRKARRWISRERLFVRPPIAFASSKCHCDISTLSAHAAWRWWRWVVSDSACMLVAMYSR
jgi:hypothetical protein